MIFVLVFSFLFHLSCCQTKSTGDPNVGIIVPVVIVGLIVLSTLVICCCRCINSQSRAIAYNQRIAASMDAHSPSAFNLQLTDNRLETRAVRNNVSFNRRSQNTKWQSIIPSEQFWQSQICAVCLCKAVNVKTHCGHGFHSACIQAWFKKRPTCPTCRAALNFITLYCSSCYQNCKKINLRTVRDIQQQATLCNTCNYMLEILR